MGSAEAAAEIRRAIKNGDFQPFERLPASRQLATNFGIARNTLREALATLEREGLVETRAGSGTYVTAPERAAPPQVMEEATPLELIDARFALEPHICRLDVMYGRREDFEELEALCDRMEASALDPPAFAEADAAFHRALATCTRNSLLIWLIQQINTVRSLDEWTRMRHLTLNEEIIGIYNIQHRAVLNAIRAREPELAATKMKEHLETARLSLTRAAAT